jgi:uncharacterized protein (TIGR03435 family)
MLRIAILLLAGLLAGQSPADTKLSFEAATIKPNATGENRVAIQRQPGGRFMTTGANLKILMGLAYSVRDFQIIGGPAWMNTDRWNVEARAQEKDVPLLSGPIDPTGPNPFLSMVQSLIEDRFQLKMHRETRELPVYELIEAKGGAKLKLSDDQTPLRFPERGAPPPPLPQRGAPMPRGGMRMGRGDLEATGVPLANFIQALSQQLGRPVIDKTGLKGLYDFKLQWTPEPGQGPVVPGGPEPPPPPADGPSIFTAIQEQLGLRLESTKGPVEVLVVDSVQKPSEN